MSFWKKKHIKSSTKYELEVLATEVLYLGEGEIPKIGRLVGFPAAVQQQRSGTEHVIAVQNGQKSRGHGVQEGVRFSNPYQTACMTG